jgi:hypothetical protein
VVIVSCEVLGEGEEDSYWLVAGLSFVWFISCRSTKEIG